MIPKILSDISRSVYAQNHTISVSRITLSDPRIPDDFGGCRIVQISDLHKSVFGTHNILLIEETKKLKPDYIFVTGDLIDRNHPHVNEAYLLIKSLLQIAPVYYVTGNHELEAGHAGIRLLELMGRTDVCMLRDRAVRLMRGQSHILLYGIDDPYLLDKSGYSSSIAYDKASYRAFLNRLKVLHAAPEDAYSILLSHRPELLRFYDKSGFDLVFAGHAHGGQIVLPHIGGILAPHQGFFPKYTDGLYTSGKTKMVVSRGLGNSLFPIRINNYPSLLLVTLQPIRS